VIGVPIASAYDDEREIAQAKNKTNGSRIANSKTGPPMRRSNFRKICGGRIDSTTRRNAAYRG
jgi:hypothetical protein